MNVKRSKLTVISLAVIVVLLVSVIFVVEYSTLFPSKKTPVSVGSAASDGITVTISYTTSSGQTGTVTVNSDAQPIGKTLSLLGTGAVNSIPAGSTITSINTNLDMTPTYAGTVSSYTVAGTYGVALAGSSVSYSSTVALSPVSPLPTLTSGGESIICSSTVTPTGIIALTSGWVDGATYTLTDTFTSPSMTITFSDGVQLSQTAQTAQIQFTFEYASASFTALTAVFALSAH